MAPDVDSAYLELARIVLDEQPMGVLMEHIAQLAAKAVPAAADVSVTLVEQGRPRTVAFSGALAPVLDERQYEEGFGPCLDAAETGRTIIVADTADDPAYPDFGRLAHRHGVHHVISIGLSTPVRQVRGALNLYGDGVTGPFDEVSLEMAAGFAVYASVAVANIALYAGAVEEVRQMRQAMESRAVIEQAKGMIMATNHCTAEDAFVALREASSRSNRKLRDIAQAMVDRAPLAPAGRGEGSAGK